jgi:hypothetical protein
VIQFSLGDEGGEHALMSQVDLEVLIRLAEGEPVV